MDVSVIIPTYNRAKKILETLDGLSRQRISPDQFEVIIVDDGSSDDTENKVQGFLKAGNFKKWKLIALKQNSGKSIALNTAILQASSTILLFIDDDIVPVPEWVESHLKRHTMEGKNVCVVGAVKYPDEWVNKSNLVRYHNSTYLGQKGNRVTALALAGHVLPPTYFAGGNSSLNKRTLMEIGMFNEKMLRGDDIEMAFRLVRHGTELVFEPTAEVIHFADAVWSYKKWLQLFQRFYRDSAQEMLKLYPEEYHRWGHWFVERPEWGKESFKRSCTKGACRIIAQPYLGRIVASFLEYVDSMPFFYQPILYKYVLTCAAIDAVNHRS